ncbi:metallophosphoesterase [Curtobacterium sp. RRHDQ10]|uniref:metallophosphoesterase n=1 Tax=Curtobacterium phyllosphaerae TaxID=3413379 RepID=UPI003BF13561
MLHVAPGTLRILHLSDTHLTGDGTPHQGSVDTTAVLDTVLDGLAGVTDVGLVVVSGDCSEDGTPASYQLLLDRMSAFARAHGAALVTVPGNHDGREGFRQVLGNGHLLGEGASPLMHTLEFHPPEVPVDGVSLVAGRRVITVDSSVPGAGYGLLRDEQLRRLRELLTADPGTDAPYGSVVVLHHSPLPAPTALHEGLRLQNPEALAAAIAGTDVRLVLAGHYHHHFAGSVGGVPVLVAPGVANDTDVTGPWETERATVRTGALLVDLAADGAVLSTPLPVALADDGREVFSLDADQVRDVVARSGPRG